MTQPPNPYRPDQPQPWGPPPPGVGQGFPAAGASGPGYPQRPAYDPTQPLGSGRPQPADVASFAPPKSKAPLFAGLAAAVVAILIAVTASLQPGGLFAAPTSTSPAPSASSALPGHPFNTPDGRVTGRWQVVEHHWTADGLQVKVWIAVDQGTLRYDFLAFDNDAAEPVYPAPGADEPGLGEQPIRQGEQREGWLRFPAERGAMTLMLMTDLRRQVSALAIPA